MAQDCQANNYQPGAYRALNIFPSFLVFHYQVLHTWYVSITQLSPAALNRTVAKTWYYQAPFKRPGTSWFDLLSQRYIELWLPFFVGVFLRRITNEDYLICEAMQDAAGSMMKEPILGLEEQRIAWFREAYWDALARSKQE